MTYLFREIIIAKENNAARSNGLVQISLKRNESRSIGLALNSVMTIRMAIGGGLGTLLASLF
jgi:hypothetical protein